MNIENLQKVIVNALENIKAQDIVVFDTTHLTSLFDRVIIATASSNRQTRALADSVHKDVKAAGGEIIATEGLETGEWVLVDCAIAVVHIMQAPIRQYYNLEEIWGEKTVDVYAKPAKKATKKTATQQDDVAKKTTKPRQAAITKTQSAQPTKVSKKTEAKPKTKAKPATEKAASTKKIASKSASSDLTKASAKTKTTTETTKAAKTKLTVKKSATKSHADDKATRPKALESKVGKKTKTSETTAKTKKSAPAEKTGPAPRPSTRTKKT